VIDDADVYPAIKIVLRRIAEKPKTNRLVIIDAPITLHLDQSRVPVHTSSYYYGVISKKRTKKSPKDADRLEGLYWLFQGKRSGGEYFFAEHAFLTGQG
jgi:hypothetical protein